MDNYDDEFDFLKRKEKSWKTRCWKARGMGEARLE